MTQTLINFCSLGYSVLCSLVHASKILVSAGLVVPATFCVIFQLEGPNPLIGLLFISFPD